MSRLYIRQTGKASLLSEADLEGLVFNTPVPFYDMGVSCGNPLETGNVPSIMMLMPEEVVGYYETYCTRAFGDSMKDLGIMTGDVLIIECVPEYHSHDIVLAEIDGEKTLKTYYVDEEGGQWLVPANKKYKATKLTSKMKIVFKGRMIHHMRRAPQDSTQHIMECIQEAKELMKREYSASEDFKSLVTKPEYADKVVARLHELSDGKLKPKDVLMPFRAAMEAGAIRRPTWAEYGSEFGFKRVSKSSFSDYTDPMKNKYADEQQFLTMVEEFRRLIAR